MTNKIRLGWWDRFLLGVAPGFGLRRIRARASAFAYEASSGGRRASGWHRTASDANAATSASLASLRELARDLHRNNGWARRGVQVIANNTVGWGIVPKPIGAGPAVAKDALDVWKLWAESTRCDWDGRMPFYGLQRLVMSTIVLSGEALVVRQPAGDGDGLPIPLRVQVLEPDYLDANRDGVTEGGAPIIQGIEFDKSGRRVAYWLHTSHPGSGRLFPTALESKRVAAENVLHIYDVERPGQARGPSWLASAIAKLNDFEDYEDAQLMQQKIAACFAAFVQDLDGSGTAIGEQDEEDDELETLEPGHISYLPPGKTVAFAAPPAVTDTSFTIRNLRRIAAGLGVTYEDLTGDYSQVNFSSARMARLAHYANVHYWRWSMVIPQLCDGVWRWVMELAAGLRGWPSIPTAEWTPPPMPMLDPSAEGNAYKDQVRSGAMTLYQMIRERGEDPDAHLAEIAAGNKKLDELGIWLDSDPRRVTTSGGGQTASTSVSDGAAKATNGTTKNGKPSNGVTKPADDEAKDAAKNTDKGAQPTVERRAYHLPVMRVNEIREGLDLPADMVDGDLPFAEWIIEHGGGSGGSAGDDTAAPSAGDAAEQS